MAAEMSTQRIAKPSKPPKTRRGTMAAVQYKSSAGGGAPEFRGFAAQYWGLDSLVGTRVPRV